MSGCWLLAECLLSVCSIDTYGWDVCPCLIEINNKLFCVTFVDAHVILDFPLAASLRFGACEFDPA